MTCVLNTPELWFASCALTSTLPERAPRAPGVKVTVNVTAPPLAMLVPTAGDTFATAKSPGLAPLMANARSVMAAPLLLLYRADVNEEVVPTVTLPKSCEAEPLLGLSDVVATWLLCPDSPWLLPTFSAVT